MKRINEKKLKGGLEREVLKGLKRFKNPCKIKIEYESEQLPYTLSFNYRPDFVVHKANGSKIYIEAKGYFRIQDQIKMRAVKRCHPTLDIRFIFQQNKPIRKGSKMKYSDWAEKYGFPYAIGEVPKEWFE